MVNPEYASLVPELSPEECESLKQSIKEANGLYVPIIANEDGIILDGHHRFKACQELGIEPKIIFREFKDKLEEKHFVVDCNLRRRHLNKFQRTELALKSKPILEAIGKGNESLGGKGDRNLTPVGRINDKIGKMAGVSRDTVMRVEKILQNNRISDKIKENLRSGTLSINEGHEIVEQDQEGQSLYQKCRKAADELNKSTAEIVNLPERSKEDRERLRADGLEKSIAEILKPFRNNFEKELELYKAYAAFLFWYEYRQNKNDIETVASKTLREIVNLGIEDGMQTIPCKKIEQILLHAAIENKVDVDKIRNSKVIQTQLGSLHREQEAWDSGLPIN